MQTVSQLQQWMALHDTNRIVRVLFVGVLAGALLFYVASSLHWPMLVDSPVIHYVVFLTKHGLRPYRDITDNNMPGSYMLERLAMAVFGSGDLGWRIYDFFLSAVLMVAMVVIAKPYDWLAGVFAAGLFALRHAAEGPWFAGEREQEMTVLIAAGCALLFVAVRRRLPVLMCAFGLLVGMAASIKPTLAPFGLLSLTIAAVALRRRAVPPLAYMLWGLAGLGAALCLDLGFLFHYDAFEAFFFVLRRITPVYVGLSHPSWRNLISHAAPFSLVPLLLLAVVPAWRQRPVWDWERWVLLLAAICGLSSYFLQRKGFFHHRYLFLAFALLLSGLELLPLTRGKTSLRVVGLAALLYATLLVVPLDMQALGRTPGVSPMTSTMQADLQQLGGDRLQGQVQCFDLILGCLNSLYHLQIVENTGFTGDLLLFPPRPNPATDFYRAWFWRSQAQHAANVLVITNEDFGRANSFQRLTQWPKFASYLAENYRLVITRSFPREGKLCNEAAWPPETALAYRIYLRKGVAFPTPASVGAQTAERFASTTRERDGAR